MRRALIIAVVVAIVLRMGPLLVRWLSPRYAAHARAMQRRLDIVGAFAMLLWVGSLLATRAFVEAALVGVCAVPVVAAGFAALRR